MPNWCYNALTIHHLTPERAEQVTALLAAPYTRDYSDETIEHTGALLLQNLLPLGQPDPGESTLDHAIRVWGTKWEVGDANLATFTDPSNHNVELRYTFDTAWSPVTDAVFAFSKTHPDLDITYEYDEPGMNFAGRITLKDGAALTEDESESRNYSCNICTENTYCEWDEELDCEWRQPVDPNGATFMHALAHDIPTDWQGHTNPADTIAWALNGYLTNITLGTNTAGPWEIDQCIEAISHNNDLTDVNARIDTIITIDSQLTVNPVPAWVSVVLTAGLTADDITALANHPHPAVARTAAEATAHALQNTTN